VGDEVEEEECHLKEAAVVIRRDREEEVVVVLKEKEVLDLILHNVVVGVGIREQILDTVIIIKAVQLVDRRRVGIISNQQVMDNSHKEDMGRLVDTIRIRCLLQWTIKIRISRGEGGHRREEEENSNSSRETRIVNSNHRLHRHSNKSNKIIDQEISPKINNSRRIDSRTNSNSNDLVSRDHPHREILSMVILLSIADKTSRWQ
jgi:hypothetical protein